MRFQHSSVSPFSADELFRVHRDELAVFGSCLFGVRDVLPLSKEDDGSVQRLAHRWTGDLSVMPWALRMIVPSWMFVWEDHSTWDEDELTGSWRITAPSLGQMVRIEGMHRFSPQGEGAEVSIEGRLEVAAAEALGGSLVDRFVQNLFSEVLESATHVIEDYMRHRSQAA